jgi:hypothetical protein
MAKIIKQRMTAEIEGDFVIFLIGMRVNSFWKIHKWLPVALAMPKMIKELYAKPEIGCLGVQMLGGIPPGMVQYWRSFEHLDAYANNRDLTHFPEWVNFYKRLAGNNDVGIWHETYKVSAGSYETIYNNVPLMGLAKVSKAVPVSRRRETAKERIGAEKNGPVSSGA